MRNEDNLSTNYNNDARTDWREIMERNRRFNIYFNLAISLFFGILFYFYTSDVMYYGSESECVSLLAAGKQLLIYFEVLGITTFILFCLYLCCSKRDGSSYLFLDLIDLIFFFFLIYKFVLLFKTIGALSRGENCGSLNSLVLIWVILTFSVYFIFCYCICCFCAILLVSG